MSESTVCVGCGRPAPFAHNYCSWDCQVAEAKRIGGKVHTPNGLPIGCIKHDGTMLEHEHGDHPDYKFPVDIEFVGDPELVTERNEDGSVFYVADRETHALIYTDGRVALTMHECCYAMWRIPDGKNIGGRLWRGEDWRLTERALEKIAAIVARG